MLNGENRFNSLNLTLNNIIIIEGFYINIILKAYLWKLRV